MLSTIEINKKQQHFFLQEEQRIEGLKFQLRSMKILPLTYIKTPHWHQIARLIIWDEASMTQTLCFKAFDRILRDLMKCDLPFGGKCIVLGGDFRQILPVIPGVIEP